MRATTAQTLIEKWRYRAGRFKGSATVGGQTASGWLDTCADELDAALCAEPVSPQDQQRIRAEAGMVALETVQASGYYLHHTDGHIASSEEVIAVVMKALDAAMERFDG